MPKEVLGDFVTLGVICCYVYMNRVTILSPCFTGDWRVGNTGQVQL